jgi:hypothetical protein
MPALDGAQMNRNADKLHCCECIPEQQNCESRALTIRNMDIEEFLTVTPAPHRQWLDSVHDRVASVAEPC